MLSAGYLNKRNAVKHWYMLEYTLPSCNGPTAVCAQGAIAELLHPVMVYFGGSCGLFEAHVHMRIWAITNIACMGVGCTCLLSLLAECSK
jgi:hypothetical protein